MSVSAVCVSTDLSLVEMPEATYEAISGAVGGYIQLVALRGSLEGISMYVHEEGKLLGLPFNDLATALWEKSFGKMTDYILGNAVLVSSKTDGDGNELPLTQKQLDTILNATKQALVEYHES